VLGAYLLVQIVLNLAGGWWLDRRYATSGGAISAIGRSWLLSIALGAAFSFMFVFIPEGPYRACPELF